MKQQHQSPAAAPDLVHNEAASRYELHIDGRIAGIAQYRREGDVLCFTHTEIETAWQGQGLGSRLAAHALDDVKSRGLQVDPRCPFIADFIERHEGEYRGMVAG